MSWDSVYLLTALRQVAESVTMTDAPPNTSWMREEDGKLWFN